MSSLPPSDLSSLKSILSKLQSNPDLIHSPDLAFFRQYISNVDLDFTPASASTSSKPHQDHDPHFSAEHGHSHAPGSGAHGGGGHGGHGGHGPSPSVADDIDDSDDDSDDAAFSFSEPELLPFDPITVEYDPNPLLDTAAANARTASETSDSSSLPPFGDSSKEPTDEDLEAAQSSKQAGVAALESKQYDTALQHFTEAILKNPHSTILIAQRADVLLAQNKPLAAIRDCTTALQSNPDSARALRTRGKAYVALGKWIEAHTDLSTAQRIDYSSGEIQSLLSALQSRIDLLHRKQAEHRKAGEERDNRKRTAMRDWMEQRQKKQQRRQQKEEMKRKFGGERAGFGSAPRGAGPGAGAGAGGGAGMPGMGGIPPHMQAAAAQLMTDPELMAEVTKNPKVMSAISELMKNPAYKSGDPEVDAVIAKIIAKVGGSVGGGGPRGAGAGAGANAAPKFTAPDVDID